MSNFLPDVLQQALYESVADGGSLRGIAEDLEISPITVSSYRKKWLAAGGEIDPCLCGRDSAHQGWCGVRFARSPRRQATLAAMHERRQRAGVPVKHLDPQIGDGAALNILDLMHLPSPN